jgi:hypothetical protein
MLEIGGNTKCHTASALNAPADKRHIVAGHDVSEADSSVRGGMTCKTDWLLKTAAIHGAS